MPGPRCELDFGGMNGDRTGAAVHRRAAVRYRMMLRGRFVLPGIIVVVLMLCC